MYSYPCSANARRDGFGANLSRWVFAFLLGLIGLFVSACGGGGGNGVPAFPMGHVLPPSGGNQDFGNAFPPSGIPESFELSYGPQRYDFRWKAVEGASYYELLEDADGTGPAPATPIGGRAEGTTYSYVVPLHLRVNASYAVRACNAAGCGGATASLAPDLVRAVGYFKASNTDPDDRFGNAVALSGDGGTLAVGAFTERSAAVGVDGDSADNSARASGAVYIFARSNGRWIQQAYVKASNNDAGDLFGTTVSLSADGSTMAVGAPSESSRAAGVDGDQANNDFYEAGAAYVFVRSGDGRWTQQAYVKASNPGIGDRFGTRVSISGNGRLLAISAPEEASGATGVDGDQTGDTAPVSGAVYMFARGTDDHWAQQSYIKSSNTGTGDYFGGSLALSADGTTLAVGAPSEAGAAMGIDGNQTDRSAPYAGAVYVFTQTGSTWKQQAYVKASNTDVYDQFGTSLALSTDGSTLAVGADSESSAAIGIDGDLRDNSATSAGAVYVFVRNEGLWRQQAYVKASNTGAGDAFGSSIALSADGALLAVGAYGERSRAIGLDGDQVDNSLINAGAVYVHARDAAGTWSQRSYVKASNSDARDWFGIAVALSGDGQSLAVGAYGESSAATGIGGDPQGASAAFAGAVYVY